MKLSVIVPVYNEEKTIGQLIKKVLAEKTPKEIIVVDDGSTDETLGKLQSFRVAKFQRKIKIFSFNNSGCGFGIRPKRLSKTSFTDTSEKNAGCLWQPSERVEI